MLTSTAISRVAGQSHGLLFYTTAGPREIPWLVQELQIRTGTDEDDRSMSSNSMRAGAPGEGGNRAEMG